MADHYTNLGNQPAGEQNSDMFNSRLGWRNEQWDAALWVKNITDQAYSNLVAAPFTPSGMLAEFLQAPRTYGATVRYSF
jgi:outer membrane receptor protein involved in Fe transport